jgi:hypothetical protein
VTQPEAQFWRGEAQTASGMDVRLEKHYGKLQPSEWKATDPTLKQRVERHRMTANTAPFLDINHNKTETPRSPKFS